jgi:hypothetical protein
MFSKLAKFLQIQNCRKTQKSYPGNIKNILFQVFQKPKICLIKKNGKSTKFSLVFVKNTKMKAKTRFPSINVLKFTFLRHQK